MGLLFTIEIASCLIAYRATYAISAHSSKQWPLQCCKQLSCCPFISNHEASICLHKLIEISCEWGPYLQILHAEVSLGALCSAWPYSSMALNTSEPNCAGKTGTWHFPAFHLRSSGTLGTCTILLQSDKLIGNLFYSTLTVPARNQVFPHIMLKN